ncbi:MULTISPECIES: YihY/virulence factor BrkB family protein [Lacticaseibacillus]|uniref:Ribonuclease BN n=2 Tax=Lacticaseibacillus TaxID=2759736 RepID=A0AAN1C7D3_LACCA|nr:MULTISPECIES: YihY/virulence factor BrkB family protein [Lacticaseibacillus]ARY91160.1 ribonuclease BN [Lacticaseibacillus casei]KAB1969095.1 YihY/virulence factor BrkB family protein [Lacticaseibacillus casei]WLV81774.1 YihY/virulence factor BrkB family protein [Lacticaseibacillus sp. NCIMB 15473]WNX25725.1 YihY/virulence factor BrkB family protein [Lacticaseibacillus casei]WNX28496.1 YihY/virulence factor BrkB family protein [Lacticaseibacillus casei]
MARKNHRKKRPLLSTEQQAMIRSGQMALAEMKLPRRTKFWVFVRLAMNRVAESNIGQSAAAIAYYALLSLFPLILFVANALPYLGLTYSSLATYLTQAVPSNVMKWLDPVIANLLNTSSGGLLGIGAVATLWAASLGVNGLKMGFNQVYGVDATQNFIIQRLLSMLMTFTLIIVMGSILIVFAFGRQFLEWLIPLLRLNDDWLKTFNTLRWPVTVTALFIIIMFLDYFLPNVKIKIWTVLPGTAFTVIGWLLIAQAFSLYMHYFGTRYLSYGTIGTFIAIMLWLNFSSLVLLWGAVINALTAEYFIGRLHRSKGKVHDFVKRRVKTPRPKEES